MAKKFEKKKTDKKEINKKERAIQIAKHAGTIVVGAASIGLAIVKSDKSNKR